MLIRITRDSHFGKQVDARTDGEEGRVPELDGITYNHLAEGLLDSTVEVVLESGNRYREVTANGVTYGVGYKVSGADLYPATFVSPKQVGINSGMKARGSFRGTIKTVTPFR